MYDALTSRYTFSCPVRGESRVGLSAFRELERLPGTAHPAVFRVRFACACGDDHVGLVAHDELDWAPLGLGPGVFLNLMTARLEPTAAELGDLALRRIEAGEWPWSFFCYPEERPRPVFPSSFVLIAPGDGCREERRRRPGQSVHRDHLFGLGPREVVPCRLERPGGGRGYCCRSSRRASKRLE